MTYAVELKHITKSFPGVVANRDVSFRALWGSIHGLIGENGAGKTTLMKILYGMYGADEGELLINGELVSFHSPKDAIEKGIGMVHQHFTLVPSMSVTQNIILGKPICRKNGLLDMAKAHQEIAALGAGFGLTINPQSLVKDLPVAMQQQVEILKALYLGASILIMDEPTAVLTPQEITSLLNTLVKLKEQGKCIILITHKLKELMSVTDSITVLRGGVVTGEVKTSEVNELHIAALMVGKEISFTVPKEKALPQDEVFRTEKLNYTDPFGVQVLEDVSFHIRRGEIVGIAGVQGNGQTELAEVIAGLKSKYSGEIVIDGHPVTNGHTPRQRRGFGLAHIPEDRQTTGASLNATLLENFIIGGTNDPRYTSKYFINYSKAADIAQEQFDQFDVKMAGLSSPAGSLSGGNLQKAIVSREIYRNPAVLIAAQPSRGVDIGAMLFIHEQLIALRDSGKAIILISSELSEIMALSDRILVMYKGAIVGETTPEESTEEDIGLLMAGIRKEVTDE